MNHQDVEKLQKLFYALKASSIILILIFFNGTLIRTGAPLEAFFLNKPYVL